MISDINEILSKDVKEVINSPLSIKLLKIYSALYLGGGQPRWCEKSQTSYYNQIAIDGIKKASEMNKEIIERTCELKSDIQIYVSSLGMHIMNSNITDKIAIEGLKKGYLKESNFVKLPIVTEKDIQPEIIIDEQPEKEVTLTDEKVIPETSKRGRPSKQK